MAYCSSKDKKESIQSILFYLLMTAMGISIVYLLITIVF